MIFEIYKMNDYLTGTVNDCVGILQKLLKHFFKIKQTVSIYNIIKTVI